MLINIVFISFNYILFAVHFCNPKKNKTYEAYSSISVQLKKRYDLILNILTIANKFMDHEKDLMEDITKLRTKALEVNNNFENVVQQIELDNLIKSKMGQIMVAVENYPPLKSDQHQ